MIGIVDYGMGNLGSVVNACRYLELSCRILEQPDQFRGVKSLILPGVGAFGDCMAHLDRVGFVDPIKAWIREDKPFLGICLGLQVLFAESEESPGVPGLGILPGKVRRFPAETNLKVPQMGWNRVRQMKPECPLFAGVPDDSFFYFVHSYYVEPADVSATAGETDYILPYTSVASRDNVMAVQFHPEKSQKVGLMMLQNFADWAFERTQP